MRIYAYLRIVVYGLATAMLVALIAFFFLLNALFNPPESGEEVVTAAGIPYPAVIAHRGDSFDAPESTEPAYMKAIEVGAAYVEADIHRTRDGHIIIFHDDTLRRTSNVEKIFPERMNDHVSTFTLEELEQLDFGSWFNVLHPIRADIAFEGQGIMTLDRLLQITADIEKPTGIVLDMKGYGRYEGIEQQIIELLERYGRLPGSTPGFADILVFSFYRDTLARFREAAPDLPRVLLIDDNMLSRRSWSRWLEIAGQEAQGIGIKGFVAWPWHISQAHERGLFVFPYVINELWQLRIMTQLNTSGYITDRPRQTLQFLNIIPLPGENPAEE